MVGLKAVRELTGVTLSDLSERLGVSIQFIWKWERGERKIPDKYLNPLSEIFYVDKNIFQQELNTIEQLELQALLLKRKIKESEQVYEYTDYDESGNEIRHSGIALDLNLTSELDRINMLTKKENVMLKVSTVLDNALNNMEKGDNKETPSIDSLMLIFERLADVIGVLDANKIPAVFKMIKSLELSCNIHRDGAFGKGKEEIGIINKDDEQVKEHFNLINKH